ncbi:MAG: hypothetical protein JNL43_12765 [Flavobacteriales bacterium]|nr:hypothetical protein [Flavobacteriales bacterium]
MAHERLSISSNSTLTLPTHWGKREYQLLSVGLPLNIAEVAHDGLDHPLFFLGG